MVNTTQLFMLSHDQHEEEYYHSWEQELLSFLSTSKYSISLLTLLIVFMCCAPMKSTTIIKFSSRMLYINFTDISVKPKTQNNALHNNKIPSY